MLLSGTMLITNASSYFAHLYIRDISTGQRVHTLVHVYFVTDMMLVPPPMTTFGDGMLVTGDSAGHVWLWDVHTGEHGIRRVLAAYHYRRAYSSPAWTPGVRHIAL